VIRVLVTGAKGPGLKTACVQDFLKALCSSGENRYLALFRARKGEDGEEE